MSDEIPSLAKIDGRVRLGLALVLDAIRELQSPHSGMLPGSRFERSFEALDFLVDEGTFYLETAGFAVDEDDIWKVVVDPRRFKNLRGIL